MSASAPPTGSRAEPLEFHRRVAGRGSWDGAARKTDRYLGSTRSGRPRSHEAESRTRSGGPPRDRYRVNPSGDGSFPPALPGRHRSRPRPRSVHETSLMSVWGQLAGQEKAGPGRAAAQGRRREKHDARWLLTGGRTGSGQVGSDGAGLRGRRCVAPRAGEAGVALCRQGARRTHGDLLLAANDGHFVRGEA